MSHPHPHNGSAHGGGHSTTGGDMNLKRIIVVGVVSLIVFAVSIVWSYRLMLGRENEITTKGTSRVPTEIGKPEIGIVDQVPFDIDHRLEIWRAERAHRLSSYGWVDRPRGIARIPIEKAMQQVVVEPPDISGEGVVPAAGAHLPSLPNVRQNAGPTAGPTESKPAVGKP